MRYMLIMRTTPEAEAAAADANLSMDEVIEKMSVYNESLIKAGVLLAAEGLAGTEEGFVVDFSSEPPLVTDGPYADAKELFAGFWILQTATKEEAAEWAGRCPLGPGVKLEVRRVAEISEFDQDNEHVQREAAWRAENERPITG